MMPAIRYKVIITLDGVHRHMDQLIEEIWIPGLNVCINEKGFCFKCDEPRADGIDIEIDDNFYKLVEEFINAQDGLYTVTGALFN